MNKVFLIGNLTKDPVLAETSNGTTFCQFSIAVNRPYTNDDGNREVDFFNVTVWRETGKNCGRFLSKGKKVGVFGVLQNRKWQDNDGNTRVTTEIVANEVEFLSPTQAETPVKPKITLTSINNTEDDGLPF